MSLNESERTLQILHLVNRFGRSYPPEPSAADIRELTRPSRRGNSFLRFGRSQPLTLTADDLYTLLRNYDDDYDTPDKRSSSFVRFGRSPSFVRLGRSADEDKTNYEQSSDLIVSGYPQRKSRARDHFIRLGRDNEELDRSEMEEEERRKRSVEASCHDCQA